MTFNPKNFVDGVGPAVSAAFLNGLDETVNNVLQGATTVLEAQEALGIVAATGENYLYYGTDSGTGPNTYVVTAENLPSPPTEGTALQFVPNSTNVGASTVNGYGVINQIGTALTGGELSNVGPAILIFNGTNWQVTATVGAQLGNARTVPETIAAEMPQSTQYSPWRGSDFRRVPGSSGNGSSDNTNAFTTANSVGAALYIPPGVYAVASNLTISVPLFFDYNAILKPAAGVTITINAPISAGPWQIFNCSSSGSAIAGKIKAPAYYPEWFGAVGNTIVGTSGVTSTTSAVFTDTNASFTAADVGKTIVITPPGNSQLPTFVGTIASYNSPTSVTLNIAPSWASGATFTAGATGYTLTVAASPAVVGTIYAGQPITTGGTGSIAYQLSGTTGGAGTYQLTTSQSITTGTSMATSTTVMYYYGTDDTAAILAANAMVGQLSQKLTGTVYQKGADQLSFLGENIYMMGSLTSPVTIAGASGTSARRWKGVNGIASIVFAMPNSSTDCIDFGGVGNTSTGGTPSYGGLEDLFLDACYSGRDLLVYSGFQNTILRNVWLQQSGQDCLSMTPKYYSYFQQSHNEGLYIGPAGRHCIYVSPQYDASPPPNSSFGNETDFINLVLQSPSVRQANGTGIMFGGAVPNTPAYSGGVDSWGIKNYKCSTGWNGDPNYEPYGSWCCINTTNFIFNEVGLYLEQGYCENGNTALTIGPTVAPISAAAGTGAKIWVDGFYNSFWGKGGITHAAHSAASVFTVAASGSQVIYKLQPYYTGTVELILAISDAATSDVGTDYLRVTISGGGAGAPTSTNIFNNSTLLPGCTISTVCSTGISPLGAGRYTISVTNNSGVMGGVTGTIFTVTFNNVGSDPLTLNYSAVTKDCGSAVVYYY